MKHKVNFRWDLMSSAIRYQLLSIKMLCLTFTSWSAELPFVCFFIDSAVTVPQPYVLQNEYSHVGQRAL